MSALVSLVATFTLFTITLCVLAGQGQKLLDDITSNLSIVFWEFVIAVPLLALVFIPLFLVTIAITITIVLPVLASIVLLVRITVNSPIFRQVLDLVSGCSPLIVRNVAQLGAWVTSIRTSAYASKLVAKLRPTPKTEPTATNALVTPIPALLDEPRRFKKRRPIKYSGAKPTPPLDPRNDASTRLAARIARIQSRSWQTDTSKKSSIPVRGSEPTIAVVATAPTQDDQVTSPGALSVAPNDSTSAGDDLPIAQANSESDIITDVHEKEPELAITLASPSLPPPKTPIIDTEITELELPSSPVAPVVVVEPAALPFDPTHDIPTYYTNSAELPVHDSLVLSTIKQDPLLPHPIPEPVHPIVTGLTFDQDTTEAAASIITENNIARYTVNDTQVSVSEQEFEVTPTLVSQGSEATQPEPLSTETTPLSTQYATQTEQSHLAHDSPNHPSLAGPTPDDTFQAEMELFATPAYQDTEMEPLDGHVDAPPTFGMSAPNTVDQGFQLGYTNNLSGTATVAGEHGLALAPNPWPFDNHGASGPDTMQVDRNTPPVSDAELLELAAAAMTAEGMEWVHDTLSSGTSGPSNQNTFALPLSDQELLELDNALQLAAASSVLQTSNDTLTTTNTHPNLEDSAPLPTDDELLELAGAAMAEDTAGMVPDNNTSIDFNLNFADIDMSFLDLSQLELPDQATQSVMGNFTNQVPNPSGALNSNELYTFNLADLPNSVHHIDPNEFARMWDELGASLKDWAGQFPGATDFSEDDMMRMLMELDAVDTTSSPSHMTLTEAPTPTPAPAPAPAPTPAAQPARKIKKLPLRRTAIENHARAMNQCA